MAPQRVKTKRKTRDLDQIHADLRSSKHLADFKSQKAPEDLPGLGRYYCVECAKWYDGAQSLELHKKGKNHKRRLRALREEPYTQKEADAAVGLMTDNGKRKPSQLALLEDKTASLDLEISDTR